MSEMPMLYGFDGSIYVRIVKMVLADKGVIYDQLQVNVVEGEPKKPDHLARHPFGKVPVLDIDGLRIRETDAICRYLDDSRPGPKLVPASASDRARMNEAISMVNSYGYSAMVGAAGYHLFPDFIGGQDDTAHAACLERLKTLIHSLMENKRDAAWLAGDEVSLADYFLAPGVFYLSLTPELQKLTSIADFNFWWKAMQALPAFSVTAPDVD